ncbi:hypothetical protein B5807_04648 [Epicoccum nigrum]|uniref:Uncharacterized protein n=1 Tax=Epicoccum nigrum TaxID=105696 RepID=A0A1Y2M4E3_EPING|nr:hypothetical protein B5807_04648 [Epicoccum nigrum]
MSFFEDFGFTASANRFDALPEERAGTQPAADSEPTLESPAPGLVPTKVVPRTSYTVVKKIPEQSKPKEGEKMKHNPYIDTPTGDAGLW